MRTIESFQLSDSNLPTVSEAGIKECLRLWRMRDTLTVSKDSFFFQLCSGKTEYVFSIIPESDNIYCGASYNIAFDMGLFGGRHQGAPSCLQLVWTSDVKYSLSKRVSYRLIKRSSLRSPAVTYADIFWTQ